MVIKIRGGCNHFLFSITLHTIWTLCLFTDNKKLLGNKQLEWGGLFTNSAPSHRDYASNDLLDFYINVQMNHHQDKLEHKTLKPALGTAAWCDALWRIVTNTLLAHLCYSGSHETYLMPPVHLLSYFVTCGRYWPPRWRWSGPAITTRPLSLRSLSLLLQLQELAHRLTDPTVIS